jgi:peptidoglycan/xylan/chitin deacetylase (PgdA/CDA1 family)
MAKRGTVIAYHAVGDCALEEDPYRLVLATESFKWQLEYLARHRTVVPLARLLAGSVSGDRPAVAITFDDGYRSVLNIAAPLLRRYGFPAVAFVPTKWIGDRMRWEEIGTPSAAFEIMSSEELLEAERQGIEIASHGHGHVALPDLPDEAAKADIETSMQRLTEILGRPPRYLAYPWGLHSPFVRQCAAEAGFEAGFSIGQLDEGPSARERVTIRRLDSRRLFAFKTSGRYLSWRMSPLGDAGYSLIRPAVRRSRQTGASVVRSLLRQR